jgi:hypothetical protein
VSRSDGKYRPAEGIVHHKIGAGELAIYGPTAGLFYDVAGDIYRSSRSDGGPDSDMENLESAFELIGAFSGSLRNGVEQYIRLIALMPGEKSASRSFSFRNSYLGGIFISQGSPIEMAEQIVHEYYHQRLWPWWLVERPADFPSVTEEIVSPVTGRSRSILTMIQALLIYRGLCQLYGWAVDSGQAESPSVIGRYRLMLEKSAVLRDLLLGELRGRSQTRKYIEDIWDLGAEQRFTPEGA